MAFFILLDNGWALATLTSVTYLIYTLLLLAPAFMPSDASRESWVRWCFWTQYARAAVLLIAAAGFWLIGFRFTASLLAALAMLTAGVAMLTSRLSQP